LKTLKNSFAGQGLDSGVKQSFERDFGQVQLPIDGGPEVLRHRKYGQTTGTKVKFYQTQKIITQPLSILLTNLIK
jgi:hypothetical protein